MTSGQYLTLNVFWSLLGAGAPRLVAIVAIPILIEGMGLARFGVLTIAWMVVGYFSLFDFGLGRSLTKLVAEKLGNEQNKEVPSLIWAAMLLMATGRAVCGYCCCAISVVGRRRIEDTIGAAV